MSKERSMLKCMEVQHTWKCLRCFVEEGDILLPGNTLEQLKVVGKHTFCAQFKLLVPLGVWHCHST